MKRNPINKKIWAVFFVVFFIGISISPVIHGLWIEKNDANIQIGEHGLRDDNDTTPPVTTISFDPPVPDGDNGWYVSNVTVTLNATDNESGVLRTYCSLLPPGEVYTEPILVSKDGVYFIYFYSVDYAGNAEAMKSATIKIDQTKPYIFLTYTVEGNALRGWEVILNATASDKMSGMNRVEFYYNDIIQEIIFGLGPEYIWEGFCLKLTVRGVIRHLEITDEYVKFYAVILKIKNLWDWMDNVVIKAVAYDNAGNWIWDEIDNPCHPVVIEPGLYLFQDVTLPNNYTGHIGRFCIKATFYDS